MPRPILVLALLALLAAEVRAGADDAGPWLRGLYGKPRVSAEEVLIAAALIADEKGWRADGAYARALAQKRGYLRDDPGAKRLEKPVRRGFAASVFARLLEIEGGLWSRVTRQSPRYAYRELVVLGMAAPGGEDLWLTGDELSGLLLAAERHRQVGPERQPERGDVP